MEFYAILGQVLDLLQRRSRVTYLGLKLEFGLDDALLLGQTLFHMGDYATARMHMEQGIALIDPIVERTQARRYEPEPPVAAAGQAGKRGARTRPTAGR
jgi:hypothetical protein